MRGTLASLLAGGLLLAVGACQTETGGGGGGAQRGTNQGPAIPGNGTVAGCSGGWTGSYGGTDQGQISGTFDEGGAFSGTFTSNNGFPISVEASVQSNGAAAGTIEFGGDISGIFNLSSCTASGAWSDLDSGNSGTWTAQRTSAPSSSDDGTTDDGPGDDGTGTSQVDLSAACVGVLEGSYWGDASGLVDAYLDSDGVLSGTLFADTGDMIAFTATVSSDGRISASPSLGISITGNFAPDCSASGSYSSPEGSGGWSVQPIGNE